jgi:hypothetical protein
MTQDEIIEMAKQAGFFINDELTITSPFIEDICISPMLKEFSKLVAAKEREACAKVCDELDSNSYPYVVVFPNKCAEAIRARSISRGEA